MKVHFLGGSDEVGASCILVEIADLRILVDAGIRVSPKARHGLSGELLPDLSPLNEGKLDAVLITHAHADHIGAIPLVLGSLPDTPVYTTPATLSLMSVMFRDALRIMDSRMEAEGELPTYDQLQVERVEANCKTVDFKQEFTINGKVNVTFYRAGHIPGAGSVFLQSDDGSILISGDLSFSPMRATPIAEIPPVRPDVMLLETTYGGKLHSNRRAEEQRLIDSVNRVFNEGGQVLIPAFALGRAQEVALVLDNAVATRKIPGNVPIYMDGMTRSITKVFERFPDYLSKGLQRQLDNKIDIFRTGSVQYVKSRDHRMEIRQSNNPYVMISSSGMLTGGASPFYAEKIVKNEKNAIFITGYQDEESPGRMLQSLAAKERVMVTLNGKKHKVKCEVGTYSLSAHADENELTQYAAQIEPRAVYLVHGDIIPRKRIRDLLRQRKLNVNLPKLGEMVEVEGTKMVGTRKQVTEVPKVATTAINSPEQVNTGLPIVRPDGTVYIPNLKKAIQKLIGKPEFGLRKISVDKDEKQVTIDLDYPVAIQTQHADLIKRIDDMSPYTLIVNEAVNTAAMNALAKELLPGNLIGQPSIYTERNLTEVKLKKTPEDWDTIAEAFKQKTGYKLVEKKQKPVVLPQASGPLVEAVPQEEMGAKIEINAAYGALKLAFTEHGLYKTGLKNGAIVLSFLTPEIGLQYAEQIRELSQKIGYQLIVHPHPNQHQLIQIVAEMCQQHEVFLVKNPSIDVPAKTVMVQPNDPIEDELWEKMKAEFKEKSLWELTLK